MKTTLREFVVEVPATVGNPGAEKRKRTHPWRAGNIYKMSAKDSEHPACPPRKARMIR